MSETFCEQAVAITNPLHPYLFLRHIYPQAPDARWLIVLAHELDAEAFANDAQVLAAMLKIPAPASGVLPDKDAVARTLTLHGLNEGLIRALVLSQTALASPVAGPAQIAAGRYAIERGQKAGRESVISELLRLGFNRVDLVESVGEFAVRGQILDVFCSTAAHPIRILFYGDEIESLRRFDLLSQETIDFVPKIEIVAVREDTQVTLADYAPQGWHIAAEKTDFARGVNFVKSFLWAFSEPSAQAQSLSFESNSVFGGNLPLFISQAQRRLAGGFRVFLTAASLGEEERIKELLWQQGSSGRSVLSEIRFYHALLNAGFADPSSRLWVLTAGEMLARVKVRVAGVPVRGKAYGASSKAKKVFAAQLVELKLGDYVVHESYGIAKYRGIEIVKDMEGRAHGEFLKLEFAKHDKLFVPVEDFYLIHKHTSLKSGYSPKLSSLDAPSFGRIKERIREETRQFCQELLRLWAERAASRAGVMGSVSHWEKEFAESFPFEETEDQSRAINEVLEDMASPKPMERLLLGDVGFGKTEVALRAAFRAVTNGKQVAMVAPTTVLAEQHFRNWSERLSLYPVSIGLLSRFSKAAEIKKTLVGLKKGRLDIAIGTHRLLQKDVGFKNLGLLILDEEHRFGVRDKEKLKFLSAHVATLYLSATPIPRTLSGALSGLKDISIIETAPVGRLPIETHIGSWDEEIVNRAIRYELGRGGQVYYVLNDIRRLPALADELAAKIPGIRTAYCHGQMSGAKIEQTMHRFLRKECDVLVASSIIESGLDIAAVNTLIVEEAQNFGLAQLYQLRGRIGRASSRAYAYFFYPRGFTLDGLGATARARLEAIRQYIELGSGMRLAMRDLEIRGAGDILGVRQHGFVSQVGLELFTKLLQEEMAKLKKTPAGEEFVSGDFPRIHLNLDAFLSEAYVPHDMERVAYYRRLGRAASLKELEGIMLELMDRCGPLPQEVKNLKMLFELRLRGRALGLAAIEEKGQNVFRFEFKDSASPRGQFVSWLLAEFKDRVIFEHKSHAFQIADLKDTPAVLSLLNKF